MPLCYGGGIKSVDHALRIIGLGVEKVALSSIAVENPEMISVIANKVGSQSVVVVLDVRKRPNDGEYEVWTNNGSRRTGKLLSAVLAEVETQGAGEIVVNSIYDDGQMKGYDLELACSVRSAVHLPMTMVGGAGSLADIGRLLSACGILGAAAGSLFVFKGTYRAVLINYPNALQKDQLIRKAIGNCCRH